MMRLMKVALSATMAFVLAVSSEAWAGESYTGSVASEVTTKGTDNDGTGHIADSDWTTFPVPRGFIINEKATKVHVLSAAGREKEYKVEYADYVEVIPGTGIVAPTVIRVKTHARSPRDFWNAGCRGWMKVRVDFTYVRYAN